MQNRREYVSDLESGQNIALWNKSNCRIILNLLMTRFFRSFEHLGLTRTCIQFWKANFLFFHSNAIKTGMRQIRLDVVILYITSFRPIILGWNCHKFSAQESFHPPSLVISYICINRGKWFFEKGSTTTKIVISTHLPFFR